LPSSVAPATTHRPAAIVNSPSLRAADIPGADRAARDSGKKRPAPRGINHQPQDETTQKTIPDDGAVLGRVDPDALNPPGGPGHRIHTAPDDNAP
jgi:hypothetical protein